MLALYVDVCRRSPGQRMTLSTKEARMERRWAIERTRISEKTSRLSVESRYNYRMLVRLLEWLAASFLARVHVWIEKTNVEWISRVNLGLTPCTATRLLFVVTAWIIDEGFRRRTSAYKPSNFYMLWWVYVLSTHTSVRRLPAEDACCNVFTGCSLLDGVPIGESNLFITPLWEICHVYDWHNMTERVWLCLVTIIMVHTVISNDFWHHRKSHRVIHLLEHQKFLW